MVALYKPAACTQITAGGLSGYYFLYRHPVQMQPDTGEWYYNKYSFSNALYLLTLYQITNKSYGPYPDNLLYFKGTGRTNVIRLHTRSTISERCFNHV